MHTARLLRALRWCSGMMGPPTMIWYRYPASQPIAYTFRMFFRRHNYQKVLDDSNLPHTMSSTPTKPISHTDGMTATRWFTSVLLISLLTTLPIGFVCFKWGASAQETIQTQLDWFSPPGEVNAVFRYQKMYTLRPDNDTNALWDSIFPRGRGFIKHPDISPETHCLSVFHQLHCLDIIRWGYWSAMDGVEPSHHAKPSHLRHCFDYLRQSIMCSADTNLEPIIENRGGVNGFGSLRKCRDFSQVSAWADKWRVEVLD
ncbi:hypothetical protein F5B22DRAFT_524948 [Xylaria bambusicola]|uniref:uncharacterized protein n=1 Tax=Xylaria bambusicola TaxID=326684 RepID=UPI002007D41D|nr:uncharacterized protein F5B22DRAFT_524948 [Xylaria bambusicola]KAI0505449.1 hypothetical protein F5B22DRAFT_524948 [Xylaria bambusicola]